MAKKKLITSALPYVNNEPHLGNIIGCVLSADTYARFCRSRGYETLYVCGTDEYGTATETKARQENLSPREICDKYHQIHAKIYQHFNISFDVFGRTSTPIHTETVQEIFEQVDANDWLIEKDTEQFYSTKLDKFLADRLIEGTCPKCQYEDARGDQCDACGALLTPTELIKPRCAVDGSQPELRSTRHLYLDLAKISPELETWQKQASKEGHWPVNAETTTSAWMKRGLEARAITRDLKWGVPVPREDFAEKVFYVWFDAPIGYVSITRSLLKDDWQKWWKSPDDTEMYQFMAKDNIPFHSVIFPATQIASGDDWTKVHHLSSTEYLNYEDTKFSKSRNIGVFGNDVIQSGIDADLWRFYLLAIRPEKQDTAFTWQEFFEKVNGEVLDNIGNLLNRASVYYQKNFGEAYIALESLNEEQAAFQNESKVIFAKITAAFEKVAIRESIREIINLGNLGNKFFQDQAPWVKIKEDRDEVQATITLLIYLLRDLAVALSPVMPKASERIASVVGAQDISWSQASDFNNLTGLEAGKPEILFQKLDMADAEKFRKRFGGEDAFKKVDLRAGKILTAENHPNAAHLYVLSIDLGEASPRTICSGLAKHIEKEELIGHNAVVVTNLSPVELSGIESNGMVLTVSRKKNLEVLACPEGIVPGTRIQRDYDKDEATDTITIDDFKAADFRIKDNQFTVDGDSLLVANKPIESQVIANGKVS